MPKAKTSANSTALPKSPTGIYGLDDVTQGGLPKGRPTLLCGAAGTGKTMFAMEFLYHGAADYNEPGVLGERLRADIVKLASQYLRPELKRPTIRAMETKTSTIE